MAAYAFTSGDVGDCVAWARLVAGGAISQPRTCGVVTAQAGMDLAKRTCCTRCCAADAYVVERGGTSRTSLST